MESIKSLISQYTPYFICAISLILLLEQISYLKRKRFLPGPTFVLPFIGNAISLLIKTAKFWEHQSSLAKSSPHGMSTNYIFGRFVLYIYSNDLTHKVFTNVRPDAFHLMAYPFGKQLFGEDNILYLFGQEHKNLRRQIAPNFTQKALATYFPIQQRMILKHLKSWLQKFEQNQPEPIPLRIPCRDMNSEASQAVFVGPYLSEEARNRFEIDYQLFAQGLLKLPINLPGFPFRNAKAATARLVETLAICAEESCKKMRKGDEPTCMLDFWTQGHVMDTPDAVIDKEFCMEVGHNLFDFLFASLDATTSALLWVISFLESHPDVLQRVRSEVSMIWDPESDLLITGEQLRAMKYTEAVAKEVLRMRPPAPLMPHIAGEDFPLTENYVIPKGTIVFPSVFDSSFQGFNDPDRFDPDRFMEERQEDRFYKRNFLAFGIGVHQCPGQRYATFYLMLFIAMFATLVDVKRARVYGCDDFVYLPTISPKDNCKVFLAPRCKRFPSF